jgi:formiminoglutamase
MSEDARLRDFLKPENNENTLVEIVGFPSDQGVVINGGRPGASKAPKLIFEQLQKMTPHALWYDKHTLLLSGTSGLKIVDCTGTVKEDQKNLGASVANSLTSNTIPVIIGGGHETSFGHFLGYTKANMPVHIVNIDAHTDVRPLKEERAHSGSPFKQALEHPHGLCKSYNVFGLNPASVSLEHLNYVKFHGVAQFEKEISLKNILNWFDEHRNENVMITMDMDAVRHADAPGVSAPNASGISKALWLELAFEFGKQRCVTSFDLCEVNPDYDRDGQTIKLAALTLWNFLLGVALREV